jgi:hypothetical protein
MTSFDCVKSLLFSLLLLLVLEKTKLPESHGLPIGTTKAQRQSYKVFKHCIQLLSVAQLTGKHFSLS